MRRTITTGYPFDNHRSTPVTAIGEFANMLHGTGVVDYVCLWDELSGWFPESLWHPELAPLAAVMDQHSTYDPFVQGAFALAGNPDMGLRMTTDAIRTGPVELLRKVLTLASASNRPVVCSIGAGEVRQTRPYGYKRIEGLRRLEDVFTLVRRLYDEPGPWSQETNFWNYRNATIGVERPANRPEFWALGAGPKLLDIAARYADGLEVATPSAKRTPEELAETVQSVRRQVEGYGRDPDGFGFGILNVCICHEDVEVIEQVLDSKVVKFFAGQLGRFDSSQWRNEGETPVMPDGWHYALKWLPFVQDEAEAERIISSVTRSMVRKSFHIGTPEQMAALNGEFVEAGADFVATLDFTPLVLGPAEGIESIRRFSQVFAQLKERQPAAAV